MSWSPDQYERFKDERSRPFYDLMALVERRAGMRVVDLGCGTGALTRALHTELAAKETLGVDSSEEMLAKTEEHTAPGLRFERGDLERFEATGAYDLVFSNAALHWAKDHESLIARLSAALAPKGQLAIQVPANFDHVSHVVADEIAREEPFASAMDGYQRGVPILAPEEYARVLDALGFEAQRVRLEVYVHHLASRDEVVEWVKGTLLTDYARRMPDALYARFLDAYRARLLPQLSEAKPYFYPFKRVLFWGRRP